MNDLERVLRDLIGELAERGVIPRSSRRALIDDLDRACARTKRSLDRLNAELTTLNQESGLEDVDYLRTPEDAQERIDAAMAEDDSTPEEDAQDAADLKALLARDDGTRISLEDLQEELGHYFAPKKVVRDEDASEG